MPFGVTDDDPELGQGQAPGGPPPGPPTAGGPPGADQGQPGPGLPAFARSRMGPQISAPGPGNMGDSMILIQRAVKLIEQAVLGLPPGSRLAVDAHKAAATLTRHMGGASGMGPSVGVEKTGLQDDLKRNVQNMVLHRLMGQQGGKGQPPGMPQQAPMPSTPLPGA